MNRAIVFSFGFSFCFAMQAGASDFSDFRRSFEPLLPSYQAYFDRAAQMRQTTTVPTHEITKAECLGIIEKIKKNYTLSPYFVESQGGRTYAFTCGQDNDKRFFQPVQVKTQFRAEPALALQIQSTAEVRNYRHTTYLDADYKILELVDTEYATNSTEPEIYKVRSFDEKGNAYSNLYYADAVKNPWSVQMFVSSDGSIPLAQQEYRMEDSSPWSHNRPFLHRTYPKVRQADWDQFTLLLTMMESGGFYTYKSKIFKFPSILEMLHLFYEDGREVCASGSIQESPHNFPSTFLPSQDDFYRCQNQKW